jgi:hypothetical protein
MRPRPPYEWKSFWFGILVLGSLAFGWVRSIHQISLVTWAGIDGIRQVQVSQSDGALNWWSGDNGRMREAGFHYESRHFALDEREDSFASAFTWEKDGNGRGISMAHWFLMLLFVIPWSAFLAWRWRRQRILTIAHDAASAP